MYGSVSYVAYRSRRLPASLPPSLLLFLLIRFLLLLGSPQASPPTLSSSTPRLFFLYVFNYIPVYPSVTSQHLTLVSPQQAARNQAGGTGGVGNESVLAEVPQGACQVLVRLVLVYKRHSDYTGIGTGGSRRVDLSGVGDTRARLWCGV
ncbi:hypothetical protein E2C01_058091 [Portunus trituberculatus]|uniref:Uncharacterized protein n=1 Tax=Portunus trituberculatus TaxID=210409 RepID=A0A5B7GYQ0_PORTR|nr:hypothetical protein [Portunus trituberculatus]